MHAPLPLRTVSADEHDAFDRVDAIAYGRPYDPAAYGPSRSVREADRTVAAVDGDEIVGRGYAYTFSVAVPGGGELPVAGVGGLAVLPTHRRRGLLAAMLRHLVDQGRARGEVASVLWASESGIYPRFGYGLSTLGLRWELDRRHAGLLPAAAGTGTDRRVRFLPRDPAKVAEAVRPVHDGARMARPGMVNRSPAWWARRTAGAADGELWVVVEGPDNIEGYASYRVDGGWGEFGPDNTLDLGEAVCLTPEAEVALVRYLTGIDLVTTLRAWGRPVDDPIQWMLADSRRLRKSIGDGAWLRLLDLPSCLAGRTYAAPADLVVDLTDRWIPENAGRWRLAVGPHGAECDRAPHAAPVDLSCDVGDLAAAFLGGTRIVDLHRAGRVRELRPGAVAAADAAFAWPVPPWGVTWF